MTRRTSPGTPWPAVARALFLYLCLAWLLVRFIAWQNAGSKVPELVYYAILGGFPIAALLAVKMGRVHFAGGLGVWGAAAVAVFAAGALPLTCMQVAGEPEGVPEIVLTPAAAGSAVLAGAELPDSGEGLRLRIRGLSVAASGSEADPFDDRSAEILLLTSVDRRAFGQELVVQIQLLSSDDGSEIWRAEYRGDPNDLAAVRRLLIRALTEAMSLTNEGLSGGQIV
ncbi:MAG: hypothetical protein PVI08_06190 [Gammaproteobacteria bacterium]